ncbi:FG-GAP repeat domain-containing protein, partial [Sphaerisporangium rufum]|uniref:FG-GAP repeat domain-containing protein n=1 Tax=Sphaerisporangium rufum TaxID=1381558 RepID=UPI00194F319A
PPSVVDGGTRFADIDGDGREDLVAFWGDGTVHVYRNVGWDGRVFDGVDTKVVASGFTDPEQAKLADLDGDGRAELMSIFPDGSVHAYRNLGWGSAKVFDGGVQKVVASGFKDATRTSFADVDGDGRADLVGGRSDGSVHVYRNLGWDASPNVYDGNVQKVVASGFSAPGTKFADIDGDGRAEIMAFYANGDVHVYRNLGWDASPNVFDGNVQKVVASGFKDASRTKFGDLDGDGRAEIVSIFADKTVHAYRNLGWDATPNVYDGNVQKIVASGFTP